jgi:hypothetical protein
MMRAPKRQTRTSKLGRATPPSSHATRSVVCTTHAHTHNAVLAAPLLQTAQVYVPREVTQFVSGKSCGAASGPRRTVLMLSSERKSIDVGKIAYHAVGISGKPARAERDPRAGVFRCVGRGKIPGVAAAGFLPAAPLRNFDYSPARYLLSCASVARASQF